jgi:thiosulfate/3-mercaptopyruvate sulfurtransferase
VIWRGRLGIHKRREHVVIVDAAWVAAHLADPRVAVVELDVSPASYDAGHIPGAVLWSAYSDLRDSDYTPVGRAELERLLSRSGISPDTTLVFYGYGAALGVWLMQAHGHADVRMLAGPREEWTEAGGGWSADVPEPPESSYPLAEAKADTLASRSAAEAAIGDPRRLLLDVRAESEYDGERFWPSGATEDVGRTGHIPGAVSLPIGLMCNEDETLKPAEELRLLLDGAGITSDMQVIAYCTIGNRASRAWFALKYLLDFTDVSVYYGSWVEWGKAPDTPIEP